MRRIAVLDAPSNLGLRPPTATSVPGCAKAPGALRDHVLLTRLGARDAGCLTPPRYDAGEWRPGDGVAHAQQIANYSRALADRIGAILDAGEFPVILGGDCSILLGSGIAMNRLGEAVGGRIGLVFVDGHSDFRHPGNASYVGAAAGEDLALVTGRGQPDLAAIEGRRPYFRDVDVVVLGIRPQDEYRLDLQAAGIVTRPVPALRVEGAARSAQWARDQLVDCAGYWVHVDVDVLDPAVMPAVDAPSPGGIAFPELELLLAGLVESPHCLGVEITVFDPDYDPDGSYAEEITAAVTSGLAAARAVNARPDLVAARADLRGGSRVPAAAAEPEDIRHRWAESVTVAAEGVPDARPGTPERTATPASAFASAADLPAAAEDLTETAADDLAKASSDTDFDTEDQVGATADPHATDDAEDRAGTDFDADDHVDASADSDANAADQAGTDFDADDHVDAGFGVDDRAGTAADVDEGFIADADALDAAHADAGFDTAGAGNGSDADAEGGFDTAGIKVGFATTDIGSDADADTSADFDLPDRAAASTDVDAGIDADYFRAHYASLVAVGWGSPGGPIPVDESAEIGDGEGADHPGDAVTTADLLEHADQVTDRGDVQAADEPAELDDHGVPVGLVPRPLGSAPLLDSEPLPATRPGMLRPRPADEPREDRFSLPVQRPAFDAGADRPADIA